MPIGVVITKNGTAISKEAYFGDTTQIELQMAQRQVNDPTCTYTTYDLSAQKEEFDSIRVVPLPTVDQLAWQALKKNGDIDQKIAFLAKKLNLE